MLRVDWFAVSCWSVATTIEFAGLFAVFAVVIAQSVFDIAFL